MKLAGARILYDSRYHAWSNGWTFYQMLAEALARTSDVVYVDAPTSLARLRRRDLPLLLGASADCAAGVRVIRTATLPAQRSDRQRQLGSHLATRAIGRWARRVGFEPDLIWSYAPAALGFLDRFPRARSVYWTGDEVVLPGEPELLERADAILCVSEPVFERHCASYGERAHFVPVAADVERYRAAAGAGTDELPELERPLYGYCGFVNERVDERLLVDLSRSLDRGTVVVAGPVGATQRAALAGVPRLVVLGPQEAERVPRLIDAFDVALIPYRDTTFNRNSNPVKLYEYLALGKPVVSTDVPTLRRFSHVASIGDQGSFVERALEAPGSVSGTADERLAVALDHSFDALLARLEGLPL